MNYLLTNRQTYKHTLQDAHVILMKPSTFIISTKKAINMKPTYQYSFLLAKL